MRRYEGSGIEVSTVSPREFPPNAIGAWDFVRRGHAVADAIPSDADVVYFQDWLADGFVPVRIGRLHMTKRPVFVNVLHSPTAWIREAMGEYPRYVQQDMSLDFAERYVAEHADFVASPSQFMVDFVSELGWRLPVSDRMAVLGYPMVSDRTPADSPGLPRPSRFRRLAFLGRFEVRKGTGLFVGALRELYGQRPELLESIEDIAFVGGVGNTGDISPRRAVNLLASLHKRIQFLSRLDTEEVQTLLRSWAHDTLVVIPSIDENYPYVMIEASLVAGLNVICSNAGGMREVLPSAADDQFFDPFERSLADTLGRCLSSGPRPPTALCPYDWNHHNRQWLGFHERVRRTAEPQPGALAISSKPSPHVDICIPFFNHGAYLPQLLDALAKQTVPSYSVTVVDDGSTDAESQSVVAELSRKYVDKSWQFETSTVNKGVSAARNAAASKGHAEYLLFLDADNVPVPHMVERLLSAIENSGDDCLTCYFRAFEDAHAPFEWTTGEGGKNVIRQVVPTKYDFLPLGPCLTLGLFDNFFGDASFIVRRSVFEALGGFGEDPKYRYSIHEDYEFLLRLVLAGRTLDVVPEVLFFYRLTDSGLTRTTNEYRNRLRVLRAYATLLRNAGLLDLAPYVYGLYERGKPLEFLLAEMRRALRHPLTAVYAIGQAGIGALRKRH
jgi:glycosyltransferase involved in cell wall biosynthesis